MVNLPMMIINKPVRFFKIACIILVFSTCKAQPAGKPLLTNANDNTLLWQISGNKLAAPSYLFGTFHLICKSDIPFGSQLKKAVQMVKEIYMELDMDDPAMMLNGLQLMKMRGDTTLKSLFSTKEYERVDHFFNDSLHTPIGFLGTLKPFFLMALIYPKMLPCQTMSGVEEELVAIAKENKKEIQGLETMALQAAVFDSIPYRKQAEELLKTIDSLQQYKKYFDTMVRIYKNQQLKELENQFTKTEFGMQENQDILLDKRNANWVSQLKVIMQKKSVFIAVGAGHLVGEKGLIALLRKEGYTVKPIENKQ
jgi:uncharacterized protein